MGSLIKETKFNIGDKVFLNIIDGDSGLVVAIVVYNDHCEYIIRTISGTCYVSEIEITNEKVII